MTDVDVEIATFVRHLNDADPRDATHTQTVFIDNKTAGADTNCRWLAVVILHARIIIGLMKSDNILQQSINQSINQSLNQSKLIHGIPQTL